MARRGACASVRGEDWRCERAFVWTYVAVLERLGQHPKSIQRGICFIHLSGAVYRAGSVKTACFVKDHFRRASARATLRRALCHCGLRAARRVAKLR